MKIRIILSLFATLIGFGAVVALGVYRPDLFNRALVSVDRLGLSDAASQERSRVARIMQLPITYEKKEALVAQTVFLGATTEMVMLALGQPRSTTTVPAADGMPERVVWRYHFVGDSRPTLFEFESDMLKVAYKASLVDAGEP